MLCRVVILMLPNLNLLDLAGASQVFSAAISHGANYTLLFCATTPSIQSALGLEFANLTALPVINEDDLVLVPGFNLLDGYEPSILFADEVLVWLRNAYAAGAQIASVCTGAIMLAEAGLLDGHSCTTHWSLIPVLEQLYPQVNVVDNVLYVHDGRITTSAGIASGIDMALSFVEKQHGAEFAAQIARYLVIYARRNGAQAQLSVYLEYRTHVNSSVHRAQDFLTQQLTTSVSLAALARHVGTSPRTLTRNFKAVTGLTPLQFQQRLRLELAANLLQNPDVTIEAIAKQCGFEDARHFRRLWKKFFHYPPSELRHSLTLV